MRPGSARAGSTPSRRPTYRKMAQAIGRLIRTETDVGAAVIMDKRAKQFEERFDLILSESPANDLLLFFEERGSSPPGPSKVLNRWGESAAMDLTEVLLLIFLGFWLMLPAFLPNSAAVLFGGGLPMDLGKSWKGKRLLGDGKTWRGFIGGVSAGTSIGIIQLFIAYPFDCRGVLGLRPGAGGHAGGVRPRPRFTIGGPGQRLHQTPIGIGAGRQGPGPGSVQLHSRGDAARSAHRAGLVHRQRTSRGSTSSVWSRSWS